MHSFKSGCSITLKLLDVPYEEVAKHVGWKSLDMAIHYSQFDSVMDPNGASAIVSSSALQESSSIALVAEKLGIQGQKLPQRLQNSGTETPSKATNHFLTSDIYMVISLIFLYFGSESSLIS